MFWSQHPRCWGQNTSRIQHKEVLTPSKLCFCFFQAITAVGSLDADSVVELTSTSDVTAETAAVYPMRSIWVTPDAVRNAKRVYN